MEVCHRGSLQTIRSVHRLSLFEEGNRPQIEKYIKEDMCKEIMRCMVENGAIDFKTIEEDGDTTILATVTVLVPDGIKANADKISGILEDRQ